MHSASRVVPLQLLSLSILHSPCFRAVLFSHRSDRHFHLPAIHPHPIHASGWNAHWTRCLGSSLHPSPSSSTCPFMRPPKSRWIFVSSGLLNPNPRQPARILGRDVWNPRGDFGFSGGHRIRNLHWKRLGRRISCNTCIPHDQPENYPPDHSWIHFWEVSEGFTKGSFQSD